jgi:hypothetical protein
VLNPGLDPFSTQFVLVEVLLQRPSPAVVLPTFPSDPTNSPAVLVVRELVPGISVLPSLVLVITASSMLPEAVVGRPSRVRDELPDPDTVAPASSPVVTAPSISAVAVEDPGGYQYHR